jgi:phosphoglycolate phosphatase
MQTLLLFDIDGTLVAKASRAHAQALREALQVVHGVDIEALGLTPRPGAVAGRTDGEIARLLLLEAGVAADRIDEGAEAVRDQCCRLYCELCPTDLSDKVIPGIPAVLEWLAGRDDVRLSLVTGNFEPVARVKLKRAGIGHWFEPHQGGFGSDSEDRSSLPPIARRRAGDEGVSWPRAQTVVIGDTPRDIACARADDLRCVAVSTGPFEPAELGDADAVARSSHELREALAGLLDGEA